MFSWLINTVIPISSLHSFTTNEKRLTDAEEEFYCGLNTQCSSYKFIRYWKTWIYLFYYKHVFNFLLKFILLIDICGIKITKFLKRKRKFKFLLFVRKQLLIYMKHFFYIFPTKSNSGSSKHTHTKIIWPLNKKKNVKWCGILNILEILINYLFKKCFAPDFWQILFHGHSYMPLTYTSTEQHIKSIPHYITFKYISSKIKPFHPSELLRAQYAAAVSCYWLSWGLDVREINTARSAPV